MSTNFHIEHSSTTATHCPYCQAKLSPQDEVVQCTHCESIYHDSCWAELDQCAMYGCEGSGAVIVRSPAIADESDGADENDGADESDGADGNDGAVDQADRDEAFVFVKPAGGSRQNNSHFADSKIKDEADEMGAGDAPAEGFGLSPDFSIDLADLPPLDTQFSIDTAELAPALHCTYCHLEIGVGESCLACTRCEAMHHQDCWAEQGRCSVYGCGHRHHSIRSPFDRFLNRDESWQHPQREDKDFVFVDLGESLWGWLKRIFRSRN